MSFAVPRQRLAAPPRTLAPAGLRGFTLIELIMVIVVLGVLAVFAGPRMLRTGDFYARGFHDETLAYLRYAQKTAVAQRRTVCVVFGASSVTLTLAQNAPTAAAPAYDCTSAATLIGPKGESPAVLNAKSGVTYVGTPTSFNFNGLGQPINGDGSGSAVGPYTIQVVGAAPSITVEAATGYVHE
jgi:MSHA pilin protein MshC